MASRTRSSRARPWPGSPPGSVRSATYPDGFHMLLRDLGRALPVDDIAAFVFDPVAPLPSGHEARAPAFLAPQD